MGMPTRDGGLWNDEDLSLRDVRLANNEAEHGGGMYNVSADPMLSDVTFLGNTATDIMVRLWRRTGKRGRQPEADRCDL